MVCVLERIDGWALSFLTTSLAACFTTNFERFRNVSLLLRGNDVIVSRLHVSAHRERMK